MMDNCNLYFVSGSNANVLHLDNMQNKKIKLLRNKIKAIRLQIDANESKAEEGQVHQPLLEITNNTAKVICEDVLKGGEINTDNQYSFVSRYGEEMSNSNPLGNEREQKLQSFSFNQGRWFYLQGLIMLYK